jgi:hypothetical protein
MQRPCILTGEHSAAYIQRLRKKVFEEARGRPKPHGFKFGVHCGNERCIELSHLQLQPWASWGRKR